MLQAGSTALHKRGQQDSVLQLLESQKLLKQELPVVLASV